MISEERRVKQVVLCGSMSSYGVIRGIQEELRHSGIEAVVPPEDPFDPFASAEKANETKREASLRYFDCIKKDSTEAILVVNVDKNGQHDYIGPNSFAEIAVAFSAGVSIYLLQDIPSQYRDELRAWGARCLHGDLAALKTSMGIDERLASRRFAFSH